MRRTTVHDSSSYAWGLNTVGDTWRSGLPWNIKDVVDVWNLISWLYLYSQTFLQKVLNKSSHQISSALILSIYDLLVRLWKNRDSFNCSHSTVHTKLRVAVKQYVKAVKGSDMRDILWASASWPVLNKKKTFVQKLIMRESDGKLWRWMNNTYMSVLLSLSTLTGLNHPCTYPVIFWLMLTLDILMWDLFWNCSLCTPL